MAGQTPRFNLNYFGGGIEGSLADDDEKYTSEDRLTIDTILTALEAHNHRPTKILDGPTEVPLLSYSTIGGSLEGGTSYYYVISFVDANGLETAAGPENSIDLPDPLSTPDPPEADTDTTAGGALTEGTYYYAVTTIRGQEESALSDYTTVTIVDENTVNVTAPDLDDIEDTVDAFQIWRQKEGTEQWTRIGVNAGGLFLDDGTVPQAEYGDPANIPPINASATTSTYSVSITLNGEDVTAVQGTAGWRVYRAEISGGYDSSSLVHEVVEHADDMDPDSELLTTWVDDGDVQLVGSPLDVSSQLQIPPFTFEEAATLPDTAGYPQNYPILDAAGVLYINRSGTWTPIAGSGGDGGGGGGDTPAPADVTQYLSGDLVSTAYGVQVPIFDPITLDANSLYEVTVALDFQIDQDTIEVRFQPLMSGSTQATGGTASLWYIYNSTTGSYDVKQRHDAAIGNTTFGGGANPALGMNYPLYAKSHFFVRNDDANTNTLNYSLIIYSAGGEQVTFTNSSLIVARKLNATAASTAGGGGGTV